AVSPVRWADTALMKKVETRIIQPTLAQLRREHIPYVGFLYIGLLVVEGEPFVLEYNVRPGDPEAEVILPRIESDLAELFEAVHSGTLQEKELKVSPRAAGGVVLVSGGYPGVYTTGYEVHLPENARSSALLFQAGMVRTPDGRLHTGGGRVLTVTAVADTLDEALQEAYRHAQEVDFKDKYYRKDIGKDL
ncbi:MAG: phosphoribosylamine--glycine ligase, partial [Bacteroidales bacterium]|nr:phosphoribosylamine--glycine ligase [Bacteroidales bacterium]